MFEAAADRKVVEFGSPEAWTYQERKAASALAWIIVLFVGVPSLAVALISAVFNAGFAWGIGADWQERIAWVAASLALSALVIGLPIARPYLRERRPEVATWALWLWLALLVFSTLGAGAFLFAKRDQAAPHVAEQLAPTPRNEIAALEDERDAIGGLPTKLDCISGRDPECSGIAERWRMLRLIDRANEIEDRIVGLRSAPRRPATAPARQHDVAAASPAGEVLKKALSVFVATLIEAASAIGLWIAAEAYVAILREKTGQAVAPVKKPETATELPAGGSLDAVKEASFAEWSIRCLSFKQGARVTAKDAFAHYETWSARNGITALTLETFGRRMKEWLARNGGQIGHSNGRYYENVALVEQVSPELLDA
jgi:hypothetical protein